jgi:hypothetical protein
MLSTFLSKGPSYTGGTELPVFNLNDFNAVPEDVVIKAGVTVTDIGTQVSPTINSLGTDNQNPNDTQSALGIDNGVERVLEPNSNYLFRITNEDSVSATTIAAVATWYQGPLSTEI